MDWLKLMASACDLEPFRAVLRKLGNVSRLLERGGPLRSSLAGPRLPASGAVADSMIRDRCEHGVDQRGAILWPGRLNLRSEGDQSLLGSFKAYLARSGIVFVGGNGHDGAE